MSRHPDAVKPPALAAVKERQAAKKQR
jgi:hypothetical protein